MNHIFFFLICQDVTIYEFNQGGDWVPTTEQFTSVSGNEGLAFTMGATLEGIETRNALLMVVADNQLTASDYENGTTNVFEFVMKPSTPSGKCC